MFSPFYKKNLTKYLLFVIITLFFTKSREPTEASAAVPAWQISGFFYNVHFGIFLIFPILLSALKDVTKSAFIIEPS